MASNSIFRELPRDIAAVVFHGKSYIFFVNSNHELCYLRSPQGSNKDFEHHIVEVKNGNLKVKCGSRQVAAMAWMGDKQQEIRIYCVAPEDGQCEKRGYIQEVAFNRANGWELGTLGYDDPKQWIDSDASLSSCALVWPDKPNQPDLSLFVSGKDQRGCPKVARYFYDWHTNSGTWVEDGVISKKVSNW
ncbi:hypothetical protein FPSE_09763 [Fusarium pseudograminearum CS3096]|uniref:Fucose-specific lectin n=1 Tax=Fusarium pseudograminearum (strain CS3096) TaxID=1028729 RepID=K3UEH5_FUSPC|nr:hypothetical protein FPSE_09763 [Fusarium pseudograminearum CS3096]EKJ70026.1 hypothetical protein FPSE_09763 [Fusarium pseudograminearum CS3096]